MRTMHHLFFLFPYSYIYIQLAILQLLLIYHICAIYASVHLLLYVASYYYYCQIAKALSQNAIQVTGTPQTALQETLLPFNYSQHQVDQLQVKMPSYTQLVLQLYMFRIDALLVSGYVTGSVSRARPLFSAGVIDSSISALLKG